jgi:hypothetical protein
MNGARRTSMSEKWAVIFEVDLGEGVGFLARNNAGDGEVALFDSKEEAEVWNINYIKIDI